MLNNQLRPYPASSRKGILCRRGFDGVNQGITGFLAGPGMDEMAGLGTLAYRHPWQTEVVTTRPAYLGVMPVEVNGEEMLMTEACFGPCGSYVLRGIPRCHDVRDLKILAAYYATMRLFTGRV